MSAYNSSFALHLKLSEACQRFGMTPRAIRYYEEQGLIAARRDRLKHRRYDATASQRLARIAELRGVGVSIVDIRDILTAEARDGGRSCAIEKLHRRRTSLQDELIKVEQCLTALSAEDRHDGAHARLQVAAA
jgi:DNA-binding transcriptional MerR regulator